MPSKIQTLNPDPSKQGINIDLTKYTQIKKQSKAFFWIVVMYVLKSYLLLWKRFLDKRLKDRFPGM